MTPESNELVRILMADDDPDDRLMAKKALQEYRLKNGISFVVDGEELMDYLRRRGKYAEPASAPAVSQGRSPCLRPTYGADFAAFSATQKDS